MTNPMVEKVARATCIEYDCQCHGDWWGMSETCKERGRAAIEAIREPTEEVIGAAARAAYNHTLSNTEGWGQAQTTTQWAWEGHVRAAHYAMIDAALKDTKP